MMYKQVLLRLWSVLLLLLATGGMALWGQVATLDLVEVEVEDGAGEVVLYIKALDADGRIVKGQQLLEQLTLLDSIEAESVNFFVFTDDYPVQDTVLYQSITAASDTFTIDILVDVGQDVSPDDLVQLSKILQTLPERFPFNNNLSRYRLFTFSDQLHESARILNPDDFNSLNQWIKKRDNPSYLYEFLDYTLKQEVQGKRIVILCSPGRDQAPLEAWRWRTASDLHAYLDHSGFGDQWLFVIGTGDEPQADSLKLLSAKTRQEDDDAYYAGVYPALLDSLRGERRRLVYSHRLGGYRPAIGTFAGEKRIWTLSTRDRDISSRLETTIGSKNNPRLLQTTSLGTWSLYLLYGLIILVLALALSGLILPMLRQRRFFQKYVKPYQTSAGRRQLDPFTNLPIEEGELVVHRCPQLTSWESWKDFGYQCPNYPDCVRSMTHLNCQGEGAPEEAQNFFAMSGINRYLHWGLFGMAGGLVAWTIFAAAKYFAFGSYRAWVKDIASSFTTQSAFQIDDLANQTLIGVAFGFGLTLMLALVEELGQSRYLSIGRITLRTLIGTVLVTLVFVGGFYLQTYSGSYKLLLDGLMWLLLGVVVGMVLSINSTVRPSRGFLGGILAGTLAFGVYLLLAELSVDYNLAKLFSLLLMGSLLGLVLVSVVAAAEDMEIEYLAPVKYHRTVPISKWLRQGIQVDIGTSQGAYIPVKWPDPEASDRHLLLTYQGGQVQLLALTETLVNDRLLRANERITLTDNSVIQLGRDGISKFRFRSTAAKPKTKIPAPPENTKGGAAITVHKK